jgi:threonine synthase
METTPAFLGLECVDTGDRYDASHTGRSAAGAPVEPVYDLDAVDAEAFGDGSDGSMWRFADLLPFVDPVTAAEGGTPLVDAAPLADELDVGRVLLKDESRNPTGTVLDRGLSLAVTAAREAHAESEDGVEPLALATPGNAGQSAAAYTSRVGLRTYAFVPSRAPFSNKAMINVHGGEMRVVGGRYPDAREALDSDLQTDWYSLQEFETPYRHEGAKTVAFEVAADLEWSAPDAVFLPCGTGEVVAGVAKGFRELRDLGIVDALPRLFAAQPSGCAPVATAFESGGDEHEAWQHPDTIVGELEIPDPAGGDRALAAVRATDGAAVAVDDDDVLESAVVATQHVGVEVGAAGGAAVAAAWGRADDLDEDATVVVVNTESGTKTPDILRSHLMGKGI